MKRIIVATLLLSVLMLVGCQSKGTSAGINSSAGLGSQTINRDNIQYNFKPVQPGTMPKLNESQKSEVTKKVDPALKNAQDTLNSLKDVQDLNLDSSN